MIIAVLAGVLAGVTTSFAVSHVMLAGRTATPEPARREDGEPRTAAATPASPAGGSADRQLAQLEQRLADVERRRLVAPGTSAPGARRPAPPPDFSQRRYEEQLRAHGNEAPDPGWATPTAAAIEGDVRTLAGKGSFKLTGVDCRSQLCTAELEWPSLASATEEQAALVHHPFRANCSRVLVLPDAPPEGDPPGPVKAKLLFECASWRSAGAQPLELGRAGTAASN